MRISGWQRTAWFLFGFAATAAAETQPLWEAGAGLTVLQFPDYRGADEGRSYVLPIPYLVYRGEFLKADRQGVRGELFDSERVQLDLSAGASPPVDSSKNRAREGMPSLKSAVELGPSLEVTLWRANLHGAKVDLRLPVRAGVTVESSPKFLGWNFSPRLNLDVPSVGGSGWNLGVLGGPLYAERRGNAYFYSVTPQFATAERPAYDARGGYGGVQFLASLSKRFEKHWVGGFVRWDSLRGAIFEDSPLVRRKRYVAAGVAVSWIFGVSSRQVEVSD